MNDPMQSAGFGVPSEDPIQTQPADLEDKERSMQGLVAAIGWAVCVVSAAAVFVIVFVKPGV